MTSNADYLESKLLAAGKFSNLFYQCTLFEASLELNHISDGSIYSRYKLCTSTSNADSQCFENKVEKAANDNGILMLSEMELENVLVQLL